MDDSQKDKKLDLIKNQAKLLLASFDTVQIFATKHDKQDGSVSYHWGDGNWFARYGQVKNWTCKQEAITVHDAKRDNED